MSRRLSKFSLTISKMRFASFFDIVTVGLSVWTEMRNALYRIVSIERREFLICFDSFMVCFTLFSLVFA